MNKKPYLFDVNMARLLEWFFGERKLTDIRHDPYLQTLAYRMVNVDKSKRLNCAILDFAALVCIKVHPSCKSFPLIKSCIYEQLNYC